MALRLTAGRTNRITDEYTMTICTLNEICPPAPPAPPPSGDIPARITEDCYYNSTCNTFNWGDGGTSWTGSGWSGSSGGGSSGGWGTTTSCMNLSTGTPIACSPGWTPYPTFVVLDGVTYTTENYPGMSWGYPWLWWENQSNVEIDPFVENNDPSMIWWDPNVSDPNTVYIQQTRPAWLNMYNNYPKNATATDDLPSSDVCAMIGGQVLTKYNQGLANNACCLRVSRALLYSGINIPAIPGQTWQGADGKNYFYYVEHLFNWLNKTFGAPDIHKTAADGAPQGTKFPDFLGGIQNRGIYIMKPIDRKSFGASGHATLWGGADCIGGKNYFTKASDVYIWKLPQ